MARTAPASMRHLTVLTSLLVALLVAACSSSSTTGIDKDVGPDAGTRPPADTHDDGAANDLSGDSGSLDLSPVDQADQSNPFPECEPGDGCFLDPCSDNKDCLSGLCVEHLGGKVCTQYCVEECPPGWSCQQISSGGVDLLYACLSVMPVLCRPCVDDADCLSAGGQQDVCVDYGPEGNFCGGACGEESPCPDGYECQLVTSVLGVQSTQCRPQEGLCECTELAMYEGFDTVCETTNEFGTCSGIRFCAVGGLSECDAPDPAPESCNGIDDDCNGLVDDLDCDDGNPCTDDSCDPELGCQHAPLNGLVCDDGNACTDSDACLEGVCGGVAIDCDDDDPCTDDSCQPDSGCQHDFNLKPCDDNDPCTVGDKCQLGQCTGTPVACDCIADEDCAALEDGDLCNGTLTCDTSKVPYQCRVAPETVVLCPEPAGINAACLDAVCDPDTGACSEHPAKEGLACSDANVCTLGDLCQEGVCTGQMALDCDDENVCTTDSCDPVTGCAHAAADGDCDDGNACTLDDQCFGGVCKGGEVLDCDDDNVCTKDQCDPVSGCTYAAKAGPCDDGNACTATDQCADKVCVAGPATDCDDGNVCTADSCDPATGCLHEAVAGQCDDNNECTSGDHCVGGLCKGEAALDCDDENPCTDDLCDLDAGCTHVNNTAVCDDGNPCTVGDLCSEGSCLAGQDPLDCDDDNVCTDDSCDPETGCVHEANVLPCDDGNLCTAADHCQAGKCISVEAVDCDDDNPCTTDLCGPLVGCVHVNNNLPCNDGDECTIGDICSGGGCVGSLPLPCDDGNVCTDDSCDSQEGCLHAYNVTPCDDGNPCTVNDLCAEGWCKGTGNLDCEDGNVCTTDYCQPETGCVHVANNAPCDDGNPCTVGDVCLNEVCQTGNGSLECSDGDPCTTDSCDPESGCLFTLFSPCCGNGIVDQNEVCDDGNAVSGDGCSADCSSTEVCGNGILDALTELCDGSVFPVDCHTGEFLCSEDCQTWYTDPCSSWCGDGVIDTDYEACDGETFPTACHEGTFECLYDCKVWDKSGCTGGYCGDGIANGGEDCDGFDFAVACPLGQCFCSSDCHYYYTETEGEGAWDGGISNGVSDTPETPADPACEDPSNLCLDATTSSLSHIWIANSEHHEVVRINVDTGVVEKEIPSLGQHPSRTAVVVADGSVWVGNRGWNCSSNTECSNLVHFDMEGNALCKVGITGMVRGVGIDQDGNVWASSWEQHKVYKYSGTEVNDETDPPTCVQLAVVDTAGCVYGAAGDNDGNIWVANNCNWDNSTNAALQSIQRIDIATNTVTGTYNTSAFGCFNVYGITVDGQGRVLLGSYRCSGVFRFTPDTGGWEWISTGAIGAPRGVVVDQNGYIYAAISHLWNSSDRRHVVRIEPDFSGYTTLDLGAPLLHPVGVAIDRNGWLWTAGRNSDSCARVDISQWGNNPTVEHFPTNGDDPYTYSDMTGFQHLMFTNPEGTWTKVYDGGTDSVYWKLATWEGIEEPGVTDISLRARSAATVEGLAQAGWTAYMTDSPASLVGLPQFRYLEVEVKLSSNDSEKTPILNNVTIHWSF